MAAPITSLLYIASRCVTSLTAPMLMGVLRNTRVDSLRAHLQAHVAEACTRGWSLHGWLEPAGLASGTSDLIPPYMRIHYPILLLEFCAGGTAGFRLYKRVIQCSVGTNRNCEYNLILCLSLRWHSRGRSRPSKLMHIPMLLSNFYASETAVSSSAS
jgi:hypothetical protein